MAAASIKYEGEKKVFELLSKLGSPQERKELLDAIGAYGVSSTQQRFLDQKSADGIEWRPSRRALKKGGQTMRKSVRLFQSLTHNATADFVEWGTNVIYARIHQFGGEIRPKKAKYLAFMGVEGGMIYAKKVVMPPRPYLGINALDEQRIAQIAGDWVEGMAR